MEDMSLEKCPKLYYRKNTTGLTLTACYGISGNLYLPDEIGGVPITEIAPYTFSENEISEEDLVYLSEEAQFLQSMKRVKTTDVQEVRLPFEIREIGRYAFYRCRNLRKLILSDGILEIGGGALSGCRGIREVEIYFKRGEKSALKSILDEVRFEIHTMLYYKDGIAEIVFPEHYEEAVEDTPARQFVTEHHGSGGDYRQCFYQRELDFKKYDALLYRARAEETVSTISRMALGRLKYPYKLSDTAKAAYEKYLAENLQEVVCILVEKEDIEGLQFLAKARLWTEEALQNGIEKASEFRKTEILSFLMDEKHMCFPKKKKSFDL